MATDTVTPNQLEILRRVNSRDWLYIQDSWMGRPGCFYFKVGKAHGSSVNGLIKRGYLISMKSMFRGRPKQLVLTDKAKALLAQQAPTPPAHDASASSERGEQEDA